MHVNKFILLLIFPIVLQSGCVVAETTPLTDSSQLLWERFSNQDIGIEFKYPAFLSISSETEKIRGSQGELITSDVINASSKEPVIYMMIGTLEDPSIDVLFPERYPPDSFLFQLKIGRRLSTILRSNKSNETDRDSIRHTLDNFNITKISGHHAALYQAELEETVIGKAYVRGAEIITEDRDISIVMLGEDSLEPELFDEFWEGFIDSLSIYY